ncbi:thiol-activated cytolysin family protein [Maribacter polysiphoniae]|uniref:Thiol-activated cytolysin n=1 Tax=Maribacter polysiphoniae TaxID=429344 RepID=A0A316DU11_9FLAO|nr:thiol-activated cytolysin family protein [Maribacter polysiphoniae]MBD1262185.1 thiol-activated cytolysin family protein [Maribacter polysiphoniae]PWK21554.1 thiol-activated cytolysin [Maribacter polysiphoniae]
MGIYFACRVFEIRKVEKRPKRKIKMFINYRQEIMNKVKIITVLIIVILSTRAYAQLPTFEKVDKKASKINSMNENTIKTPVKPSEQAQRQAIQNYLASKSFKTASSGTASGPTGYKKLEIINNSFKERFDLKEVSSSIKENSKEVCTTTPIEIKASTKSFMEFTSSGAPDWMKPGVILKASGFLNGSYVPVLSKRHPVIFSSNITGSKAITIEHPESISNLQEAVNSFKSIKGTIAANISFDYKEIHSLEEFGFQVNGKYSNSVAGISATLGMQYGSVKKHHYYMIDFFQNMFFIDVDPKNKTEVFVDASQPVSDLVYVSRVVYGRRGIVVVESDLNLKEFGANVDVKLKSLIQKGSIQMGFDYLKQEENFKVKALFYGGESSGAINSAQTTIEKNIIELSDYLEKKSGNPSYALPIAYELKNMNNESIGMRSIFKQTVKTCVPPLTKEVKLKVTLTDLQCIDGRDGKGNPEDYGFQQWIIYKSKGRNKSYADSDLKVFPKLSNCNNHMGVNNNSNILICSDKTNQIHVEESNVNRNGNIGNSLTFIVSPEDFQDKNTTFSIYSWLKEFTGNNDLVIAEKERIDVDINQVIAYLLDPDGSSWQFTEQFYDHAIAPNISFKPLGSAGQSMWLRNTNRGTLEGPIRLAKPGNKAAAWIHFGLLD